MRHSRFIFKLHERGENIYGRLCADGRGIRQNIEILYPFLGIKGLIELGREFDATVFYEQIRSNLSAIKNLYTDLELISNNKSLKLELFRKDYAGEEEEFCIEMFAEYVYRKLIARPLIVDADSVSMETLIRFKTVVKNAACGEAIKLPRKYRNEDDFLRAIYRNHRYVIDITPYSKEERDQVFRKLSVTNKIQFLYLENKGVTTPFKVQIRQFILDTAGLN